jgi:hypothetical protein
MFPSGLNVLSELKRHAPCEGGVALRLPGASAPALRAASQAFSLRSNATALQDRVARGGEFPAMHCALASLRVPLAANSDGTLL